MTPSDHFSARLAAREKRRSELDRLFERIGTARLVLAVVFLVLAWFCAVRRQPSPAWLWLPAGAFLAAVLVHQRVKALRARAARAVGYYQRRAPGLTGERFLDPHHVYGDDLDLFGPHSLYASLCTARTPMGENTLAGWLLTPADLPSIHERQACIVELRDRLDLREDLAILGDTPRIALHRDAIARWLAAPNELSGRWLKPVAWGLATLALVTAAIWGVSGVAFPFLSVLVIEAAVNYALRDRVQRCVAGIEHAYEDLRLLAALLARIESESFEAAPLRALKDKLASHSMKASQTFSRLATIVNFVEARRNPFLAPVMLPLLYTIQSALAAERWRALHGGSVAAWLSVLGDVEALESIAGYSFERPDHPFPEFVAGPASFVATGLGHPLLPAGTRVCNDVAIHGATRLLLVSGSNMSGKSTLLRSVGMNTVLAMAGAPVCARSLRLTPMQVGASIRVNDSLSEGSSRFYAEITRLRQLFEPCALPLLFLLDELLQGTNSTDRRIGAQGVVRALLQRGAIGLVSTHDLTLAGTELDAGALRNVHFQDELVDGKLNFDFTLRDGVVTKSNGIELMRAIGLEV